MKTNFSLLVVLSLLVACASEQQYRYNAVTDNIYFDFTDTSDSRLTCSFAYTPGVAGLTVAVPVKISGPRAPRARYFRVEPVAALTTAREGEHYGPVAGLHEMPADSGACILPVELYNSDPLLADTTLVVAFRLVPTGDFTTDFPLTSVMISFSNRLEKPAWWDFSSWSGEMGSYSRNKHYLFLISSGTIDLSDPATEGEKTIQSLNYIKNFKAFIFDPVSWVARHEEYAFVETVPGLMYEFYEKANPAKKIQCMIMNMGSMGTRYAFFDDNNAPTIFYI
ncbi:MAG: DUF4843 domain-containing protein [Odoribacteraceae bacterium]|jgi:hypothetical protein|nr:DUF4843 domain-containing protein [Odoribacteraceae bacterium]